MKINQNVTYLKTGAAAPAVAPNKSSAATGASAAQGLAPAPAIASAAKIPLTSLTSLTTGDFDAARVAEIRESIRAGSYKVDTARIADGVISSVRNLVGKNL